MQERAGKTVDSLRFQMAKPSLHTLKEFELSQRRYKSEKTTTTLQQTHTNTYALTQCK